MGLLVYAAPGHGAGLVCVGASDTIVAASDRCEAGDDASEVTFEAALGTTYYAVVYDFDTDAGALSVIVDVDAGANSTSFVLVPSNRTGGGVGPAEALSGERVYEVGGVNSLNAFWLFFSREADPAALEVWHSEAGPLCVGCLLNTETR